MYCTRRLKSDSKQINLIFLGLKQFYYTFLNSVLSVPVFAKFMLKITLEVA